MLDRFASYEQAAAKHLGTIQAVRRGDSVVFEMPDPAGVPLLPLVAGSAAMIGGGWCLASAFWGDGVGAVVEVLLTAVVLGRLPGCQVRADRATE